MQSNVMQDCNPMVYRNAIQWNTGMLSNLIQKYNPMDWAHSCETLINFAKTVNYIMIR